MIRKILAFPLPSFDTAGISYSDAGLQYKMLGGGDRSVLLSIRHGGSFVETTEDEDLTVTSSIDLSQESDIAVPAGKQLGLVIADVNCYLVADNDVLKKWPLTASISYSPMTASEDGRRIEVVLKFRYSSSNAATNSDEQVTVAFVLSDHEYQGKRKFRPRVLEALLAVMSSDSDDRAAFTSMWKGRIEATGGMARNSPRRMERSPPRTRQEESQLYTATEIRSRLKTMDAEEAVGREVVQASEQMAVEYLNKELFFIQHFAPLDVECGRKHSQIVIEQFKAWEQLMDQFDTQALTIVKKQRAKEVLAQFDFERRIAQLMIEVESRSIEAEEQSLRKNFELERTDAINNCFWPSKVKLQLITALGKEEAVHRMSITAREQMEHSAFSRALASLAIAETKRRPPPRIGSTSPRRVGADFLEQTIEDLKRISPPTRERHPSPPSRTTPRTQPVRTPRSAGVATPRSGGQHTPRTGSKPMSSAEINAAIALIEGSGARR